jgi:hypothetical protein
MMLCAIYSPASSAQVYLRTGQVWPSTDTTINAQGKTAVVLSGFVSNAAIGPVTVIDAFRVVETKDDNAVINQLKITSLTGQAVQRECIRLRGFVTNALIDGVNCTFRDTPQISPNLPEGLHLESGSGIVVENSSFNGFQMTADPGSYWNGDGIATERTASNIRIINVSADNNTDAGFDLKSSNTWLDGVSAEGNARNYRFWGSISVGTMTVGDTIKRGGTASTAGIWIEGSSAVPIVQIDHLIVRMTTPGTIIRVEQGPVDLRIGSCDIQAPTGGHFLVSESSATRLTLGPGCPTF